MRTAAHRLQVLTFCLGLLVCVRPAAAQPHFGAADDPREAPTRVLGGEDQLFLLGGLSLLTIEPNLTAGFLLDVNAAPFSIRLGEELRTSYDGLHTPTVDEWYDVLRLLQFARLDPTPTRPVYARVGPTQRMRLGQGHLVNFFSSATAWDEREVGAEGQVYGSWGSVGAFADNVLLNGVVGGQVRVRPLGRLADPRLNTLEIGAGYVTDLHVSTDPLGGVAAFNVDANIHAFNLVDVYLAPYVSYASFFEHGQSWAAGVSLASDDLIGLARFKLRLGLLANSREFIPGYYGSLYTVSNRYTGLWDSKAYFRDAFTPVFDGLALEEAGRALMFETELRALFFRNFELWIHLRDPFPSSPLGELHVYLFVDPEMTDRFRFEFGVDRYGIRRLGDIFTPMDDLSAMVFKVDYRLLGNFWALVYSRYTYKRVADGPNEQHRFLAERRFEPFVGLRYFF